MPIPFCCPHCQLETLVDDEFAGQSGPCAGCGKMITVPHFLAAQALEGDEVVVGIPGRRRVSTIAFVAVGAVVAGVGAVSLLVTLLFPAFGAVRAAAHQHRCVRNLEKIAHALRLYEGEHGSLPPAYIADDSGQPMHSWRVLILPYLDQGGLYAQYDFSQPWDSPPNLALARNMPSVFACPSDPESQLLNESNYMVIVGPETLFPGVEARRSGDIADDRATTLAVVESPVLGTPWTQPNDLSVESMQFVVNGEFGLEIGSRHREGAHALMADGQVRFLSDFLPSDYLAAMASVGGDEQIPPDLLETTASWR